MATRRLFGYKTVDDYYRDASSKKYLSGILHMRSCNPILGVAVPYLALNALDDPVVPEECMPYDEVQQNENTILATTPFGGHVAFLNGWNLLNIQKSYMDDVAIEFFKAILQKVQ